MGVDMAVGEGVVAGVGVGGEVGIGLGVGIGVKLAVTVVLVLNVTVVARELGSATDPPAQPAKFQPGFAEAAILTTVPQ